jgi:hypothetical protein
MTARPLTVITGVPITQLEKKKIVKKFLNYFLLHLNVFKKFILKNLF